VSGTAPPKPENSRRPLPAAHGSAGRQAVFIGQPVQFLFHLTPLEISMPMKSDRRSGPAGSEAGFCSAARSFPDHFYYGVQFLVGLVLLTAGRKVQTAGPVQLRRGPAEQVPPQMTGQLLGKGVKLDNRPLVVSHHQENRSVLNNIIEQLLFPAQRFTQRRLFSLLAAQTQLDDLQVVNCARQLGIFLQNCPVGSLDLVQPAINDTEKGRPRQQNKQPSRSAW
jgi:hypothetical protein